MRLLVCGGGTGGHIYPALAVIAKLQDMGLQAQDMLWVGTQNQMEERLVPSAGVRLRTIRGGPVAGVPLPQRLASLFKLASGFLTANRIISQFRPHGLLLTGGYVNVPVALAAWLQRIPAVVYLPDIEPGAAIRQLIRFARWVAASTSDSRAFIPEDKMVVTGYPVRSELRDALQMTQGAARSHFGLEPDVQTVFVFGGSRGALSINRALMSISPQLLSTTQVIHISGELNWPEVEAFVTSLPLEQQKRYRAMPFLTQDMGVAYRAATLVVARAGASMLGECPAFAVPSILIPYPYAWRYQKVNADYLVTGGAAVRIDDQHLADNLLPTIVQLLNNAQRLEQMSSAARKLDQPAAAQNLANLLLSLEDKSHG